ncbi:hypothetical protein H2198_001792 [Neophaeococcomyces mojaviensis]|uniref:Uncharacterized protein n=1 Tax=Neophaeococcomyces mojaviensis TaxID=3383035 RepID=A0ACC3AFV0_9EURO|nr:hypothetical protein H2198_001792 [Knufia sp. JES_112]
MKLSLWDTAGQETYKSVTRSYFRGASGALLVFDITRRSTFDAVTDWLNDLRQIAEEGIVIVLVGNKLDLADHTTNIDGGNKRAVTRQEAEEWCKREGIVKYVETSAKSGENVERAFLEVAERIYQNIEAGKYDLNDRRSGVKGYGSGSTGVTRTTQNVSLNDGVKGKQGAGLMYGDTSFKRQDYPDNPKLVGLHAPESNGTSNPIYKHDIGTHALHHSCIN